MKTILHCLALAILLLTSCKTTRRTIKSESEERVSEQIDRSGDLIRSAILDVQMDINDSIKIDEIIDLNCTYTKFSKPDSAGHQYIEETGRFEGRRQKATESGRSLKAKSRSMENVKEHRRERGNIKNKYTNKAIEEENFRASWWNLFIPIVASLLVVLIVIHFFFKS